MPVAVQTMRTAQVESMLMIGEGFRGTLFVQTADGEGYRPRDFTSDWAGNNVDSTWDNAPASFDGSVGITGTSTRCGRCRVRLSEMFRGLGRLSFAQHADGSFGPNKFVDAADNLRTHTWSSSAKRFKPEGGVRPASY